MHNSQTSASGKSVFITSRLTSPQQVVYKKPRYLRCVSFLSESALK